MKRCAVVLAAALSLTLLAGCGDSPDRQALARQTVQKYWYNIGHGKLSAAYYMMTSGNRAERPLSDYRQDMFLFLTKMGNVVARTGKPSVDEEKASVPVTLTSPKTTEKLKAYQHLFWEDGHWRISDPLGGLSQVK